MRKMRYNFCIVVFLITTFIVKSFHCISIGNSEIVGKLSLDEKDINNDENLNSLGPFIQKEISSVFFEALNQYSNITNSNEKCYEYLLSIGNGLVQSQLWAVKMLDAWAKLPSGIFYGHLVEMGNFEECLKVEHGTLLGQYCLAKIPIDGLINSTITAALSNIQIGICIPAACDPDFIDSLLKFAINQNFNSTINKTIVSADQCQIAEKIIFQPIDWFASIFFMVIIAVILLSTIYELIVIRDKAKQSSPIFIAFSLVNNSKILFRTDAKKSPNIVHCLNGIRSISIIWIVFGHSYMMSLTLANVNSIEILDWIKTPFSMFLQSATASVDSFFFLSGFLLAWTVFGQLEKTNGKLNVPLMYFHRYLRLTPIVAVTLLFFVSLFRYMGNGPLWRNYTSSNELCGETWWATLLYVQNYAYPGRMCVGHTWYLAVDFQLYLISPLILIPLWKWGKKAVGGVILLGVLTTACLFTTIMINDFSVVQIARNLGADSGEMRLIYYSTHVRMAPWLIGILMGQYMYKRRGLRTRISKIFVILGWLTSFALLGIVIFVLYPSNLPDSKPLTTVEGAFYLSLSRIAWPLALAWIVFACVNGYAGFINIFLSWSFWQPFGRLTFCIYIIHLLVESVNAGRTKTNTHFSDYDAILRFWQDFGITISISILAYMAFEAPIISLEKVIFKPCMGKKEPNIPATVSKANLFESQTSLSEIPSVDNRF